MTDLATGLYAHGAIMAALLQRMRTGKGQKINCDLLSTQVQTLSNKKTHLPFPVQGVATNFTGHVFL